MKFLVLLSLVSNLSFGQTAVLPSDSVIAFNEQIAQAIIDGNRSLDTNNYLTREDLNLFLELIPDSLNADSVLQVFRSEYDLKRRQFSHFYTLNFIPRGLSYSGIDSVNWENCSVDSSWYQIRVLNPNERDQRIKWPESNGYKMGSNNFEVCLGQVFVSEGENRYVIAVESLRCGEDLKFYHTLRAPRIGIMR